MALGPKETEVLTVVNSIASATRNIRTGIIGPSKGRLSEIGSVVVLNAVEEAETALAMVEAKFLELDSVIRDIERIN